MDVTGVQPAAGEKRVGLLFGILIFFAPVVFAWFLLQRGYSTLARIVGFAWMTFFVVSLAMRGVEQASVVPTPTPQPSNTVAAVSSPPVSGSASASGAAASTTNTLPSSAAVSANPSPAAPPTKWDYSESVDQMRGTTTKFAMLESENELDLGFPYESGKALLTIRRRPEDGLNVMLKVGGQFMCSAFTDSYVSIKFDDGPIGRYRCTEPSDVTTGVAFIENESRLVEKMRTSKTMIIEAEFFQHGRQQLTFDVAGLQFK